MYPDLSYFFHDIFGTDVDNWTSIFKTFGLLLVLAILSAAYFFYLELKRKANEGIFQAEKIKVLEGLPASTADIASSAIFGFILGFKGLLAAQDFTAFKADPAAVILSAKGHLLGGILGAAIFAAYRWWDGNRRKLPKPIEKTIAVYPHDRIGDVTIVAAITGLIGAKMFAIIEDLPTFFKDPLGTFFSGSGLAIYGGLIVGFLGVLWFLRKHKIPVFPALDALAPAFVIAYGVGRLGCQFSGDGDWGIEAAAMPGWWFLPDWMWSYDYPHNVVNDGVPIEGCTGHYCMHLVPGRYPTPLWEAIVSFVIAGILWVLRKRLKVAGMLFFVYLIFNGIQRYAVETIRVNDRYDGFGGMTQAQIIATALILAGVGGFVWLMSKRKQVSA